MCRDSEERKLWVIVSRQTKVDFSMRFQIFEIETFLLCWRRCSPINSTTLLLANSGELVKNRFTNKNYTDKSLVKRHLSVVRFFRLDCYRRLFWKNFFLAERGCTPCSLSVMAGESIIYTLWFLEDQLCYIKSEHCQRSFRYREARVIVFVCKSFCRWQFSAMEVCN